MTRNTRTNYDMNRLKKTLPTTKAFLLLSMGLMTLTSLTACKTVKVIRSDEVVIPLLWNESFTAPMDGWFMSDALYLRYRKAVADRILEQTPK
jgi:hypothetical protein